MVDDFERKKSSEGSLVQRAQEGVEETHQSGKTSSAESKKLIRALQEIVDRVSATVDRVSATVDRMGIPSIPRSYSPNDSYHARPPAEPRFDSTAERRDWLHATQRPYNRS